MTATPLIKAVTISGTTLAEVVTSTRWDQDRPSTVWNITHRMGKYPSVTVVDSAGQIIEGDVTYESSDSLVVTFNFAFSGTAYLN